MIERIIALVESATSPLSLLNGWAIGGAASRVAADATAVGDRSVGFELRRHRRLAAWRPGRRTPQGVGPRRLGVAPPVQPPACTPASSRTRAPPASDSPMAIASIASSPSRIASIRPTSSTSTPTSHPALEEPNERPGDRRNRHGWRARGARPATAGRGAPRLRPRPREGCGHARHRRRTGRRRLQRPLVDRARLARRRCGLPLLPERARSGRLRVRRHRRRPVRRCRPHREALGTRGSHRLATHVRAMARRDRAAPRRLGHPLGNAATGPVHDEPAGVRRDDPAHGQGLRTSRVGGDRRTSIHAMWPRQPP